MDERQQRYPGPFEARSPEDANWLDRHGYPTQAEVDGLGNLSAQDLAERAAAGDVAALALLGAKQLDNNEVEVGYDNLGEAAALGSIWAIIAMAERQLRRGNYSDAMGLYNLAALRGDWQTTSLHLTGRVPSSVTPSAFSNSLSDGARLLTQMNYLRQQRGLAPLVNVPRPNILYRNYTHEPVGVYRRKRG